MAKDGLIEALRINGLGVEGGSRMAKGELIEGLRSH
jgi:hypothetical protein